MTEKRFTYINASRTKYIGSFFCNGVPLTNDEVNNHLNKLYNENQELKQDLKYFIDITTLTKAIELVQEVYDKYLDESSSDPIAIAKRQAIIECISKLENYLEDLDA